MGQALTSAGLIAGCASLVVACSGTNPVDPGAQNQNDSTTTPSAMDPTMPPTLAGQGGSNANMDGQTATAGVGGNESVGGGQAQAGSAATTCGEGFSICGSDCVRTDQVCGSCDSVCGIGQTCNGTVCEGGSQDVVVEAENFTYRFNPGNLREWYPVKKGLPYNQWVVDLGADNYLTGYPCRTEIYGDRCDDTSNTNPDERGGGGYLEIMPDTRQSHADQMLTYCSGYQNACANPEITSDPDLAVITEKPFPGYKATDQHLDAEFYPIPGDGPSVGYKVNFTTAGTYIVWGLGGRTTSEGNSIHVGINRSNSPLDDFDQTWKVSGRGLIWCQNGWTWRSHRRADVTGDACGAPDTIHIEVPTPGTYTVWFSMREDGFQFDKWIATLTPNNQPNGSDQPEVGRVEVEAAQPAPAPAPLE